MSKNIVGIKALEKKLDNIADPSKYEKALGQSAMIVEASAKKKVPVDTGMLRQSIATDVDINKMEAYVGTPLEYAPYVEYGTGIYAAKGNGRKTPWVYPTGDGEFRYTVGQRPQPYLGPALRQNRDKIQKTFNKVLAKELRK